VREREGAEGESTAENGRGGASELASRTPPGLTDDPSAWDQILHDGTHLHCESNARYTELLKRHVFDQADFDPYRRRLPSERRRRWIGSS